MAGSIGERIRRRHDRRTSLFARAAGFAARQPLSWPGRRRLCSIRQICRI